MILFGLGTFKEWIAFKVLLDAFCEASGMCINMNKSCFLHNDLDVALLGRISGLLPYRFAHLNHGFNYLGFFLKPSSYLIKDWHWLISKFEKRISHWTNRLLSMIGRIFLIRSVLSSIPVFWMAIVLIPSSILDILRKLIFSFLWGSSTQKKIFTLYIGIYLLDLPL